jgi:ABC-type multidrug transport system fused ATPase/permease subunit
MLKVIEIYKGTHDELVLLDGLYAEMVRQQSLE